VTGRRTDTARRGPTTSDTHLTVLLRRLGSVRRDTCIRGHWPPEHGRFSRNDRRV